MGGGKVGEPAWLKIEIKGIDVMTKELSDALRRGQSGSGRGRRSGRRNSRRKRKRRGKKGRKMKDRMKAKTSAEEMVNIGWK